MIDSLQYQTTQDSSPNKKKPWLIIIIVVLLLGAVGFYFYNQSNKSEPEEPKMEKNLTPTEAPSPTPEIDKESVKIQVLNGTGTPGEAASAVEALTGAGYKEDNIETGNAEEYDHAKVSIQVKSGFEAAAEDIKKALSSFFDDIEIDSTKLDEDSDYDIVVTTGGEIYEEPTTAPTTVPTKATTPITTPVTSPTTASTPITSPSTSPTP
ncbi:hypothetical protein A2774_00650 [Candidatus Roizmanbacteria bacterium RIFCSPHIGHO2_01_FULL_39_12c]|uniref:LytR/CpsA/Psr regulator C-terminal domain-containing protein n=1 Tax=Candidatus Roizmanbacteria bacterium RIFCSPHIGHO2_01_FULL_39_12c TaxID=1802031 RepID=A0A1F7GA13_9BACT|nr:MAG: hypothetical protein A2774_00650 [Candidatus Roizmanbacteria bacterium RIFCSPHIGHO2_01_FULL_39_12c]OGK47379.1 MAG: hypothetical protein A2963_04570 [Candidatus Roizmanbacteria bacterium RIFCSPLOWO2_01_FULL_40_13]